MASPATPSEWDSLQMPAMATQPKMIFFTDFDGTITLMDSNDYMTDTLGYGRETRLKVNDDILAGTREFRDGFQEMLDTVKTPFPECVELLKREIKLDPDFKEFFDWAKSNNVPIVVLSGGMESIIEAIFDSLIGPENTKYIQIISNTHAQRSADVPIDAEGGWKIVFRHPDSGYGHDKSRAIRPYAALPEDVRPIMLYAGDGVSDLSAARETDLLFAKEGRDLITWCAREKAPFVVFKTWKDIHQKTKQIFDGETTTAEVAKQGFADWKASQA